MPHPIVFNPPTTPYGFIQLQVEQQREQKEQCSHKTSFDALLREQVEDSESDAEQMQAAILQFTGKQKWGKDAERKKNWAEKNQKKSSKLRAASFCRRTQFG